MTVKLLVPPQQSWGVPDFVQLKNDMEDLDSLPEPNVEAVENLETMLEQLHSATQELAPEAD